MAGRGASCATEPTPARLGPLKLARMWDPNLKQTPLECTHHPPTKNTIIHVTTLSHRGRVGPPPSKGVTTTYSTAIQQRKRNPPIHPPSGKRGSRCGFLLRGV